MSSRENTDPYHVDILLYSGGHHVFRSTMQTGIYYFHSGITQRTRDDFGTAVVTIKPYLGDENTDRLLSFCHYTTPKAST